MAPKHWIPLESNPEILTKFGHALGLSPLLTFADVWSIELLAMVPAPRYAVMLLYPLTEKVLSAAAAQEKPEAIDNSKKQPYFCKQTIGNACGTIALLHAALNANSPATPLVEGSFLEQFCSKTADMTPQQRAAALHDDASLDSVHEKFAQEGQTTPPDPHAKIELHFVCFTECDGVLYELDGRKDAPVPHGSSSPGSILEDASRVIQQKFMALDPAEHRFTILALTHDS